MFYRDGRGRRAFAREFVVVQTAHSPRIDALQGGQILRSDLVELIKNAFYPKFQVNRATSRLALALARILKVQIQPFTRSPRDLDVVAVFRDIERVVVEELVVHLSRQFLFICGQNCQFSNVKRTRSLYLG